MDWTDYIMIATFIISAVVFIIKLNSIIDELTKEIHERTEKIKYEFDCKIDTAKIYVQENFVSKELFSALNQRLESDIKEIKSDIKKLLSKKGFKNE